MAKGCQSSNFKAILTLFCGLLGLFNAFSVLAQSASNQAVLARAKIEHQLPHIEATIDLDGKIDEAVWQKALKISLNYETKPGENIKPSVETDVYLFEDGKTLFVAFDARDPHPEQIRDFLLDRDNIWNSDFVGLKFDTFGEARKAFQFFTNAAGIQADAIQEDFRGDDQTWDAIWDSEARITKSGFQVEMAIPFRAIRFPAKSTKQRWGIELLRFLPRKNFHRIANSPVDRNIACSLCQFDYLVGLEKIKPSKNIRLIPTLTLAQHDSRAIDSVGLVGPWASEPLNKHAGLDLRWGISDGTYLNATYNPDFSQVEADAAQLDINRTFSIFFAEKRPFFLDGSDYFNSMNQLVHTRNVIEPDYGLKVTGQSGGHSYGAIAINDNHTRFLLPSSQGSENVVLEGVESQNQILRYSYDFGGKNTLGIVATNKTSEGYNNQMTAIDGKYWINPNHSVTFQLMHSSNQYSAQMLADYGITNSNSGQPNSTSEPRIDDTNISGNGYDIDYVYDTRNWQTQLTLKKIEKGFRADLGFIGRVDFDKKEISLRRVWYPILDNQWWHKISLGGNVEYVADTKGTRLEKVVKSRIKVEAAYQSAFGFGVGLKNRLWDLQYFDEKIYFLFGNFEPLAGVRLGAKYRWGKMIDFVNSQLGDSLEIAPKINWQVNQNIITSLEYSKQTFDVSGGELFNASIVNFRLSYLFDERSSLRWTLQQVDIRKNPMLYNSFSNADLSDDEQAVFKSLATQLLYTYRINPQTLIFAGYSDSGYQDVQLTRIRNTDRNLFVKFSYAWQL